MRIAVIDDERLIRKDLIYYLKELVPEAEIEEADSGFSAVELANSKAFDIFFLDINLGDMKGTVLALMLQKTAPAAAVVFVTAYGEYGPQAFELNAADYIMKPFNKERVEKALRKAIQLRRLVQSDGGDGLGMSVGWELSAGASAGAPTGLPAGAPAGTLAVHHGRKVTLVEPGDIVYVESTRRSCCICCRDGKQYVTSTTLTDLESRLTAACQGAAAQSGAVRSAAGQMMRRSAGQGFLRVHKSFIINLDFVSEITMLYAKNYCVKMKGYEKTLIPVGRNQIKKLKDTFQI